MTGNFARVIGVRGNFIRAFGIAGTSGVGLKSGCDGKAGVCSWLDAAVMRRKMRSKPNRQAIDRGGIGVSTPSEGWQMLRLTIADCRLPTVERDCRLRIDDLLRIGDVSRMFT